ncbi:antibiotic biosynthesis monooxygenase family protein [Pseudokordiimonas caeni]|uniref:antibiotic biosynthesis monooxygenase family protein n=1 Tax=Pseudokordiimonas caeni TaxID=2997908 RepID=UPI00281157AD|nr:antibiotic biosynthesis monooxygenase [Pseudokordiimonas caeni]
MSSHGSPLARTPEPPYYAVIFSNIRNDAEPDAYAQTAEAMVELAAQQDGYLGVESVRDTEGVGITVSYWRDEAAIKAWKKNADHRAAQAAGQKRWYRAYITRVAKVERTYALGLDDI